MFKSKSGFTLAEMMVVMLILSIVLAAMAPVMTTRNKTDYSSPWRYASNGSDAYFAGNSNSNQVAMIGQHEVGTGEDNARLILRTSSGSGWSHLMFKTGDTIVGRLYLDESNLYLSNVTNPSGSESTSVGVGALTQNTGENNTAIGNEALHNNTSGIMNTAIGSFSLRDTNTGSNNIGVGTFSLTENTTGSGNVAIGTNALQHNTTGTDNIAIGTNAASDEFPEAYAKTISLGYQSLALGNGSISIGSSMTSGELLGSGALNGAYSVGLSSIAIGNGAVSGRTFGIGGSGGFSSYAIAIGTRSEANESYTIAMGYDAQALGKNVVSIGKNVRASADSVAIGSEAYAHDIQSVSIGANSRATGKNSVVLGADSETSNEGSVAIGYGAKIEKISGANDPTNSIAIGRESYTTDKNAIAIGYSTNATGNESIAIGKLAEASGSGAIAIGTDYLSSSDANAEASGIASIAIGRGAKAVNTNNIAIGADACKFVKGSNKVCIGDLSGPGSDSDFAKSTNSKRIIFLGNDYTNVYIPGNLIVGGKTYLGVDLEPDDIAGVERAPVYMNFKLNNSVNLSQIREKHSSDDDLYREGNYINDVKNLLSDRRLKYVGNENKAGLDKIRQLKVFNYTFKKDEKKTPHVGVIAQDLQKVFPNAVKKGVDGFLTIRMEDMFYAVINAIKELDSRVTRLEKENQELKVRIERLEAKVK